MWREKRPLIALLIAGAAASAVLLVFAWQRTGSVAGQAFNSLDSTEYYNLALNLTRHGTFSQSTASPFEPDTWRTPGYPLFLAGAMRLVGESPAGLIIIQQLLNIANVLLLFTVARQHMSDRGAVVVGLLFVMEPYHQWYSLWLMPSTLFVALLLLAWRVWQCVIVRHRWRGAALLGAIVGFTILVRPLAILLPAVVLIGLAIKALRRRELQKGGLKVALAALVGMSVVPGVWMARNKVVAGQFALSHQSGVVVAYFKASEVMLWRLGRTADRYLETSLNPNDADKPHPVWDDIDTRLRNRFADLPAEQLNQLRWLALAQGNKTELDAFEISAALRSIGLEMLLEEPLSTLGCCLVRCLSILTFPLNLALDPPAEPFHSSRLKAAVIGCAYLALVLAVLFRLWRGGLLNRGMYFPLACTLVLLLATTPQFDPRFRVPMIPFLLVAALCRTDRGRGPISSDTNRSG